MKRKGNGLKARTADASTKQRTLLDAFVSSKASSLASEANMKPPGETSLEEATDNLKEENNDRRSPSVVIIEDTLEDCRVISRLTPQRSLQESPANRNGESKDQPIVIDSPIRTRNSVERDKAIHPFFLPKSVPTSGNTKLSYFSAEKQAPGKCTEPNPSHIFPSRIPQHVRGFQTIFACNGLPPSKICREAFVWVAENGASYDFLKSPPSLGQISPDLHEVRLFPLGKNVPVNQIPEDVKTSHPAVARLIDLHPTDKPTSRRPWTDRWRPSCAQDVLGNEESALYLRNWLLSLELQLEENGGNSVHMDTFDPKRTKVNGKSAMRGVKRPRVIRSVKNSYRKRLRLDSDEEDDSWIIYTDDEDGDEAVFLDDDHFFEFDLNDRLPSPPSSVPEALQDVTKQYEQPAYLGQLYNTILLTGPPGCGKTASVYACAEELGWDVFEVYPGIGRRNAANIDNLIGEVGKNHLVLQTGDSLRSFLQPKAQQRTAAGGDDCIALSQISPRKKGAIEENLKGPRLSAKSVQQSLILLEEVDILFKDDTNFWTTVAGIIRECKRPVVCTCNDISLVPVHDLPLQATLTYAPCPEGPAAYYLQALCAAEGYNVGWKELLGLYSDSQRSFNQVPDLRATINTLQAISVGAQAEAADQQERDCSPSTLLQPRSSVEGSENLSFLDRDFESMYDAAIDSVTHGPSEDDETGHLTLFDRHGEGTAMIEAYDRQREMHFAAERLVNSVFAIDSGREEIWMNTIGRKGQINREAGRVAVREICRMAEEQTISLEYLPYLRQIVEAEDVLEKEEEQRRPRVGRMTRNSTRSQYVRMVELTEEARCGVEMSRLNW